MNHWSIETWLLIFVTAGNILLVVDRWVHRRAAKEQEINGKVDGAPSVKAMLETAELLRIERAKKVTDEIQHLRAQIEQLHKKASDQGDSLQVLIGRVSMKTVRLESRMDEAFRLLRRRISDRG